ncbi:MAG: hypothetical protein ABI995_08265 [Acidobacteriota bacterium]
MKQKLRNAFGYFLLFMALLGALLPLVQGWVFFLAAVGVLGKENFAIKWCLQQLERLEVYKQHFIVQWFIRGWKWFRNQLHRLGIWRHKDLPPGGPSSTL